MVTFDKMAEGKKKRVILIWKSMSETDKTHFINQVAITLSVLGAENGGKKQVEEVVSHLITDGANNLADFGLYLRSGFRRLDKRERRTIRIIDNYRMKYNLPTLPSKPLV